MSAVLTTALKGRGKGRERSTPKPDKLYPESCARSRSFTGSDTVDPPLSLLALQQKARQDCKNTQAQLAVLNQGI